MPFSSGVYTLPNPALVTGEVVSATENNTTRNDLAGALNLTFLRNGTSTATANLPIGGYKLTGLGVATTSGDALSYGQAAVVSDITATGSITVNSGTANGVAYLNGSKVLTTGSALTFDGTNFTTTGSATAAALIPSGATVPTNGLFLPVANTVGWATNSAERMRIDSSGNLLVGKTATTASVAGMYIGSVGDSYWTRAANNNYLTFYNSGGTQIGYIQNNANSIITYSTSSDYRLKENIQPMQNALDVVAQLNPVTYTWKADGSDGQGFIAHELQAVVPDCVTGEKDAVDKDGKPVYQGIDTSFLVGILTKAIQELKAELDATKAEVAALKAAA